MFRFSREQDLDQTPGHPQDRVQGVGAEEGHQVVADLLVNQGREHHREERGLTPDLAQDRFQEVDLDHHTIETNAGAAD